MPVYAKGPGRWRVAVWSSGSRRDWIVAGTKRDAETFEAQRRIELAAGSIPTAQRAVPTLARYLKEPYLPSLKLRVAPETYRVRLCRLEVLVAVLGDVRLGQLDPLLPGYQDARKREGRAVSTVNDELRSLRAVVNHARGIGYLVPKLQTRFLPRPKRSHKVKVLTSPQVLALLEAVKAKYPRILDLVILALHTGMRPGETIKLRMQSVELAAGLVWVEPSEAWKPKDREARAVPITPELRPWLERREGEEWFAVNSFRRAWLAFPDDLLAECFKTAKIAGGHPHILRHTYASTWLSRGGDVYTLSKVLGHADVRLTLETYAHLIPGHLQASAGIVTYGATVGPAAAAGAARGLTSVPPALPGGPPTRPKRR